ncbi:hypothetical protein [Tsukamurella spumae]|uniref:Uncharacterized protein n=1 Tax=Tsukamurella spumae TaxID=44753 RepID=A0A846X084_9ACTN|nr:hypothetical protein [Tsukamurella spumae]NKY18898.1 hypothetical protein [Tsukamurella spumae]
MSSIDPKDWSDAIQARIVTELKEMRRDGLTVESLRRSPVLMTGWNSYDAAKRDLEGLINDEASNRSLAWLAAALVPPQQLQSLDLTRRRERFASTMNISTRTLIRHEDEAIDWLAEQITSRILKTKAGVELAKSLRSEFHADLIDRAVANLDRQGPAPKKGSSAESRAPRPGARPTPPPTAEQRMSIADALDAQDEVNEKIRKATAGLRDLITRIDELVGKRDALLLETEALHDQARRLQARIKLG